MMVADAGDRRTTSVLVGGGGERAHEHVVVAGFVAMRVLGERDEVRDGIGGRHGADELGCGRGDEERGASTGAAPVQRDAGGIGPAPFDGRPDAGDASSTSTTPQACVSACAYARP